MGIDLKSTITTTIYQINREEFDEHEEHILHLSFGKDKCKLVRIEDNLINNTKQFLYGKCNKCRKLIDPYLKKCEDRIEFIFICECDSNNDFRFESHGYP